MNKERCIQQPLIESSSGAEDLGGEAGKRVIIITRSGVVVAVKEWAIQVVGNNGKTVGVHYTQCFVINPFIMTRKGGQKEVFLKRSLEKEILTY